MDLDTLTHDELDRVAADRAVDPYPSSGTKAVKVAAIRAVLPLPAFAEVVSNAALSGWPRGEVRTVEVDGRLLRRAANGLVTVLSTLDGGFDPDPYDPDALVGALSPDDETADAIADPARSTDAPPTAASGPDADAPVPADPDDVSDVRGE